MAIVQLPNDNTAVLKDPDDLTNKEIKTIRKALRHAVVAAKHVEELGFDESDPSTWDKIAGITDEDDEAVDAAQRVCVFTRLRSWTLDRAMPADADEVDDLPLSIYKPIAAAAVDIKFSDDDFSVEGVANPKAVTAS